MLRSVWSLREPRQTLSGDGECRRVTERLEDTQDVCSSTGAGVGR